MPAPDPRLPSLTILVTAFREASTIGDALRPLAEQARLFEHEIIVICPDDETAKAAQAALPGVILLRDPARGKPAALNLGLSQARGEVVVMTDGDVFIGEGALDALLAPFADGRVGAVSGRPISRDSRRTLFGFWSHLLTEAGAHAERLRRDQTGAFFVCSGYLYAIRRDIIDPIPEDALAEDAVVSHLIALRGYTVRYAPGAEVMVKYPTTYRDWLRQKVRSAGGYAQPYIAGSPLQMRSFRHEALNGTWRALRYPRTPREAFWTLLLFAARLHLWLLIFWRVRVRRTPLAALWQRVETTK